MLKSISLFLLACAPLCAAESATASPGASATVVPSPLAGDTVDMPKYTPISLAQYKELIAAFEGNWTGEIRPTAVQENDNAATPERTALTGRVIQADIMYAIQTNADGLWELYGVTSFGASGKKLSYIQGRTYLKDGVLHSEAGDGQTSVRYVGLVREGKIVWSPEAENGPLRRTAEWVEQSPSGPCLRTQTYEILQGKDGPIYIRLDGYFFRKNNTKPQRMETFERASTLLNQ